jgi:hypothetical protein
MVIWSFNRPLKAIHTSQVLDLSGHIFAFLVPV